MPGSRERVMKAFRHEAPDRTPLFEIFQPFHPIHWDICGRNAATDQAMCWDALAEGVSRDELAEEQAKAQFAVCRHFGLDMVRLTGGLPSFTLLKKTGEKRWNLDGADYVLNERTKLIQPENPGEAMADSKKINEKELIEQIEKWDGTAGAPSGNSYAVYNRVRELASAEGVDWVYMGEIGAGTGAAFYPPFQLMWLIAEPEFFRRWIDMVKTRAFAKTEDMLRRGYDVIALGGDVSSDKGPFISPAHYHEFILPVIKEHVDIVHEGGGLAVYTSDGNHWPIKDDFFFNSGIDGYKEVDKAAGMTMERLIEEGIDRRVCIIGNLDARHTLCHGTEAEVREEVFDCLEHGRKSPGGHILHASHSVHEDVKIENYYAAVNAYREYFGLGKLGGGAIGGNKYGGREDG